MHLQSAFWVEEIRFQDCRPETKPSTYFFNKQNPEYSIIYAQVYSGEH